MQEEDNNENDNNENEDDKENELEWSMLQCMPCAETNLHTTLDQQSKQRSKIRKSFAIFIKVANQS